MTPAAPRPIDPDFPGVAPEVVEAYRNAPDSVVAEILDGALSLAPRPRPRRAKVATRLASALGSFHDPDDGDPGGWIVLVEPELRLGSRPDIIDPDLAGRRRERLPEEPEEAAITVPPTGCARSSPIAPRPSIAGPSAASTVARAWVISGCAIRGSRRSRSIASKVACGPSSTPSRATPRCGPSRSNRWSLDLARLWRW